MSREKRGDDSTGPPKRRRGIVLVSVASVAVALMLGAAISAISRPVHGGGAARATDSAAAPRPPVTVAFEFPQDQIVFEAFIGDRGPFNLILDTAVNPSVVDLTAARELGLPIDEMAAVAASGVGTDRVPAYPTELSGLAIGPTEFPPFPAVAMNLRPLASRLGRPLHGALGYSFLRTRAVRIDYPGRRITFFDGPGPHFSVSGASELPFVLIGTDVHLDSVYVNGKPVRAILDTGASPGLTISTGAATGLGLGELTASATQGVVRGARGTAPVLRATADSLRVGTLSLQGTEIAFAPWVPESAGLLGNGFLGHFILTVDYVSERLSLEAPALEH